MHPLPASAAAKLTAIAAIAAALILIAVAPTTPAAAFGTGPAAFGQGATASKGAARSGLGKRCRAKRRCCRAARAARRVACAGASRSLAAAAAPVPALPASPVAPASPPDLAATPAPEPDTPDPDPGGDPVPAPGEGDPAPDADGTPGTDGSLPVGRAPTGAPLAWAPPALVDPITIELDTGFTHTSLSKSRDYIVKLPPIKKIGATWLDGGHNVVVIGGAITVPPESAPGVENDSRRRAIYVKGATGTVHIEGVEIDGSGGGEFDGIAISAPEATVQLENLRVVDVRGGFSSFHADVVQPWGGVKDLRIDRMTASSNYQGLMLQPDLGPIGSAEISNVDLTASADPTSDKGGHLLWVTKGSQSCTGSPMTLSDVFVLPRAGRSLSNSVWPPANSSLECGASGETLATWPRLAVAGGVHLGLPPGGSFVPAGSVGIGYSSPGYAGS